MFNKLRYAFVGSVLLAAAFWCGWRVVAFSRSFYAGKQVALRIGNRQNQVDYDLLCAINFLKYQIKKSGYHIAGESYFGNLYPKELDGAGVNIFVRGFTIFFDERMDENGQNIFYIHRNTNIFKEELQQFDAYLSSQQKMKDSFDRMYFFAGGYVPHPLLEPVPEYDVLYIYEYSNPAYFDFLRRHTSAKIYGGMHFAALSEEERAEELKKARLVVYEMGKVGLDDETYVPYAVYDLMSYGRPVLTNAKPLLQQFFYGEVFMFSSLEEMATKTLEALRLSDDEREARGRNARDKLEKVISNDTSVGEILKKLSQKKLWSLDYIN